ncbi:MAG TPA: hypothetical protein VGS22_10270 [Thermoanaerobaculia bacterium]|jgi:hypothetical protein|nr:hypothetical protein [Thermoanaerobaculia bacterium]
MRKRAFKAAAAFLCVFLAGPRLANPAPVEDPLAVKIAKAAGSSAAGKGAEVALKLITGFMYDNSCNDAVKQAGEKFICDILGSASGRAEDAWKEAVDKKLKDISKNLDVLKAGQEAILAELGTMHKEMQLEFDQAALKVEATKAAVTIEGLWKKYQAEFKPGSDVTRDGMVEFATNIVKQNLDQALQNLNVALTTRVIDGQPMLRYPFHKWREIALHENFPSKGMEIYDFSEKKFMEYRILEEKAYAMYLWAATVIESKCQLEKATACKPKVPVSTAQFKRDFERYTREQVEVFNSAVDWFVLSYSPARSFSPGFLQIGAEEILLRANFLTASILTPSGQGMWGRVVSMGNAWDGTLKLNCGGAQTLKPVFQYAAVVEGNLKYARGKDVDYGPLDWWVSSAGDATYDQVRFSDRWKIYHYSLPTAGVGSCEVVDRLPAGGVIPWLQRGTVVVPVKTEDGRSFPFGSFLGIQRAGGTYALLSGIWKGDTAKPVHDEKRANFRQGKPKLKTNEFLLEPTGHPAGPWIGLLSEGRGEWDVHESGSRVGIKDSIQIWLDKKISFPEDSGVTLHFGQASDCPKVCRPGDNDTTILAYDVENNDTEKKKGLMFAAAGIYFHPEPGGYGWGANAQGQGIYINGSYGSTGDRKTMDYKVEAAKGISGRVKVDRTARYYLNFALGFDLETEGRGLNATEWMYRGKLTPAVLFLTK